MMRRTQLHTRKGLQNEKEFRKVAESVYPRKCSWYSDCRIGSLFAGPRRNIALVENQICAEINKKCAE